jgi:hypothetical protein
MGGGQICVTNVTRPWGRSVYGLPLYLICNFDNGGYRVNSKIEADFVAPTGGGESVALRMYEEQLSCHFLGFAQIGSPLAVNSPRLAGEGGGCVRLHVEPRAKFSSVIVHRPAMRVIDGACRLRAAAHSGDSKIEVQFCRCAAFGSVRRVCA